MVALSANALKRKNSESVRLVHIRDRLFDGTDEPVVVVVAAEGHGTSGQVKRRVAPSPQRS